jgi:hypothetical protein
MNILSYENWKKKYSILVMEDVVHHPHLHLYNEDVSVEEALESLCRIEYENYVRVCNSDLRANRE